MVYAHVVGFMQLMNEIYLWVSMAISSLQQQILESSLDSSYCVIDALLVSWLV